MGYRLFGGDSKLKVESRKLKVFLFLILFLFLNDLACR